MFIMQLPKWVMTSKFPAFYDSESLTATEQTARVYGKMNELIESWNQYVEDVNKQIKEFGESNDADYKCFTDTIIQTTTNYIQTIDFAVAAQNKEIKEIYARFSSDILAAVKGLLEEMKANGELEETVAEAVTGLTNRIAALEAAGHVTMSEVRAALPYYQFNPDTEALELMNIEVREVE